MFRFLRPVLLAAVLFAPGLATAFDHWHAAWSALLARHVVVADDGRSSAVDYAGFLADRSALDAYLASLSAVRKDEFGCAGIVRLGAGKRSLCGRGMMSCIECSTSKVCIRRAI